MDGIKFIRAKKEGGPGYPYGGNIYHTKIAARLARLEAEYRQVYGSVKYWVGILPADYLDRLVGAGEMIIDGRLWVNSLVGDGVVATVASSQGNGVEYLVRQRNVLTCDCEGYIHVTPFKFEDGIYQSFCVHILVYVIYEEMQNERDYRFQIK